MTTRQPADVGERQAGQPVVVGGRRRGGRVVASADARTASWVSTTPLGAPVEPLVATTSASPGSTGRAAVERGARRRRRRPRRRRIAVEQRGRGAGRAGAGRPGRRRRRASHTRRSASTNAGAAGQVEGDEPTDRRPACRPARLGATPADVGHDRRRLDEAEPNRGCSAPGRARCRPRSSRWPSARRARSASGRAAWWRAPLALVVSLALQVGVNYANDYSDGVRGTDDVRVGPVRLVRRAAWPRRRP